MVWHSLRTDDIERLEVMTVQLEEAKAHDPPGGSNDTHRQPGTVGSATTVNLSARW